MSVQESRRFEAISPKAFEHPTDRAATAALRSIPLMDKVLKRLLDIGQERRVRQLLIANAVQISERQVPRLWARHVYAASVLDLPKVPDLFVTQTPMANALAVGARHPMVIIFSGLVTDFQDDEVDAVLAHEMGHVLSEHNYYQTALVFLTWVLMGAGLMSTPLTGLPVRAVYMVLLEWSRAAELSADRASALVVGDPLVTCRMLMKTAGGSIEGLDLGAFLAQAARYDEEEDLFARWSRAKVELQSHHPFAVRRARELMTWVNEGGYDRVVNGSYVRRGQEPPMTSEVQAAVAHYRERFVKILGTTTSGVERTLRQAEDWLRRRSGVEGDDGDDDATGTVGNGGR